MAFDDRDYLHRPLNFRRPHTNEEFWRRVQRRRRRTSRIAIVVGMLVAALLWFAHVSGMSTQQAATRLWSHAANQLASLKSNVEGLDGNGFCEDGATPKRLSVHFEEPEQSQLGRVIEYINESTQPILVRVVSAEDRTQLASIVLPAGAHQVEPSMSAGASLEVQRAGRRWCGAKLGWPDSTVTRINGTLPTANGKVTVALRLLQAGEPSVNVTIGGQGLQADPLNAGPMGQFGVRSKSIDAQERKYAPLRLQPSQSEADDQRRAVEQRWVTAIRSVEQTPTSEADAALNREVRSQTWRDVPPRDIRLVTTGSRHYVGGQVGDEEVQFEIRRESVSAIGESLAMRAGASRCKHGKWMVFENYWTNCQRLIPMLKFGNVTLENVMVAVVEGDSTPILGWDLVGPGARVFRGPDGNYLSVGQ